MKQLFLLWLTMAVFSGAVAAHMNDYPEQSVKSSSPVYHFNLQAGNSRMTEDVKMAGHDLILSSLVGEPFTGKP